MADKIDPEVIRDFIAHAAKFGDALERMVTLAEMIVSTGDDTDEWRYPDLSPFKFGPLLIQAFSAAERAGYRSAWPAPKPPLLRLRFGTVAAGWMMYHEAMMGPWFRWQCKPTAFKDKDGTEWQGHTYPDPATFLHERKHSIRPSDLDKLRFALKLVRLPLPVSDLTPPAPLPDSEWIYGPMKSLLFALGYESPSYRKGLNDAQERREITYEEVSGAPRNRGFKMLVIDPARRKEAQERRKAWRPG